MAAPRESAPRRYFRRFLIGPACVAILAGIGALSAPAGQLTPSEPLVSLDAQGRPLGDVLAEVARQTGITITLNNQWRSHPVNASIQQMPLTKALKRILASLNHTVVYESGRQIRIEVYGQAQSSAGPPPRPAPFLMPPVSPPDAEPAAEPPAEENLEEPDQPDNTAGTDGDKSDQTAEPEQGRNDSDSEPPPRDESTPEDASPEKPAGQN